jgi:Tfp pilus assembly protein FimT
MAGLAPGLHPSLPNLVTERMRNTVKNKRQAGFSTLEMLMVIAMSVIITAIAVPSYLNTTAYLRVSGDLRQLNALTALAKMRAAADFTRARLYADLTGNVYQLQVWNKVKGCWLADTDVSKTCITYSSSSPSGTVIALSQGDTFGLGSLSAGPTPGQSTIAQAGNCYKDDGTTSISNSACILFNSRGVPIDPTKLSPTSSGAFYVTNATLGIVDGVTVSSTGSMQTWSSSASTATWKAQ